MEMFLLLMFVLRVSPVHGIFDGACPRKEPPPGVLVLSPGSKLVLSCSGHVKVDGVKVTLTINSSDTNKRGSSSDVTPTPPKTISNSTSFIKSGEKLMQTTASQGYHSHSTEARVSAGETPGENGSLGFTDTGYTASPRVVQPTSTSRLMKDESDWEAEEMEGDYEDEEGEEGSRVTRGVKPRPQWKRNRWIVGKGDRDWGEISFGRSGGTLSLASVRLTDSGKYTCHHRGREKFAVKVIVAEPPERPTLFCYKKSPSSKIRCESSPQKSVLKQPTCYLSLSKSPNEKFHHFQCSYSYQQSRCWCALDFNDDEIRTLHMAFLCVTSITGNATSPLLPFTPLSILTPDPPSNVTVHQEEGHDTRMTVTWNLPASWKLQDSHYKLIYELKYRPAMSSVSYEQIRKIKGQRSETIADAMPGVEYLIQLRAKDEFDGQWSQWNTHVYATRWKVAVSLPDDLMTPEYELPDLEGSGSGAESHATGPVPDTAEEVSRHVLWISGLCAILSVILAVYMFSLKDRFMSKLHNLSVITPCGDLSPPPPSVPMTPEGQALVTFGPPRYKERSPSDAGEAEENEEEQIVQERTEAVHFNNTSYFLLRRE